MNDQGIEGDPSAVDALQPPSGPRKIWLILRACAIMFLSFGINIASFTSHDIPGCLLGCLTFIGGLLLTYSKGSGFRHRFGSGES